MRKGSTELCPLENRHNDQKQVFLFPTTIHVILLHLFISCQFFRASLGSLKHFFSCMFYPRPPHYYHKTKGWDIGA